MSIVGSENEGMEINLLGFETPEDIIFVITEKIAVTKVEKQSFELNQI